MMRVHSYLPKWPNRHLPGWIQVDTDGGIVRCGPFICFGKADNERAIKGLNPGRDPVQPYGDHPSGEYVILGIADVEMEKHGSYGPVKIVLEPVSGHALTAKQNGRTDLLIHG